MRSSLNKKEKEVEEFVCRNCSKLVKLDRRFSGTEYRNHCPFCLWSVHLGQDWPDHKGSVCSGKMEPIGLTFKHEGKNKYGQIKQGELMVVHQCRNCRQVTINRIAADDNPDKLMETFKKSLIMENYLKKEVEGYKIMLLNKEDEKEIIRQLFGKTE